MNPLAIACILLASIPVSASAHWVATWSTAPCPVQTDWSAKPALWLEGQTIHETVHVSLGGSEIRVRLSNEFGSHQVVIGGASVAVAGQPARRLAFAGRQSVMIPPDGEVVSDAAAVDLPSGGDLAISLFIPARTEAAAIHYGAMQTATIEAGDTTLSTVSMPEAETIRSWVFLSGVDVETEAGASTVVAFGDSITDSTTSTLNANHRWPDVLASVLRSSPATRRIAVVNAGISGNRLLHDGYGSVYSGVSALARFGRDVLAQPGARTVVILEGINDLGHAGSNAPLTETVTAADVTGALSDLAARAHENGLNVYLGTLLPFEGCPYPGYYTPAKNEVREQINAWIRSNTVAEGVVDFDLLMRDPSQRRRMLPAYDCGDHLHPNDAGYRAMGAAVASIITGHGLAH